MTQLSSFNKSSSGKNFFGVMLVVALALHAAVLGIPTGANSKSSDNSKATEKKSQVDPFPSPSPKVTPKESESNGDKTAPTKPILKKSLPITPRKSLPQVAKKTTVSNTQTKTTLKTSQKTHSQATTTRRQSSTASTSTASTSKSSTSKSSTSTASTSILQRQSSTPSSSTPKREQAVSRNSTNLKPSTPIKPTLSTPIKPTLSTPTKPLDAPPPQKIVLPNLDNLDKGFPYYLGSLLTSGGILKSEFNDLKKYSYIYHTTDELDKVAADFKQELQAKGFTIKEETNDRNFQVYRVTKNGKEQFLHFVSKNNKTAIFMDAKSYKLDELENKSPESKPSIVVNFYDAFKEKIRDNSDWQLQKIKNYELQVLRQHEALKNLSKTTGEVEIEQLLLDRLQVTTSPTKPVDVKQIAERITSELSKGDNPFTFTKVDGYGGEDLDLYEVKQGEFKIYMILTSTPEIEKVTKTAILFAKKDPRE